MGFICTDHGESGSRSTFCPECEGPVPFASTNNLLQHLIDKRSVGQSVRTVMEHDDRLDGMDVEDWIDLLDAAILIIHRQEQQ